MPPHWTVTSPQDLDVIIELNRGASDRAVGIIAASLVEIHLTDLIKTAFINDAAAQQAMFSSANAPLGSLAAKIQLAYLMGMISEQCCKELDIMRHIRNRFAHRLEIGSFDHQEIASRCQNFKLVDRYVIEPKQKIYGDPSALFGIEVPGAAEKLKNPKERYCLSAQIFSIGLQHATVEAKPYVPVF